VLAAFFAGIAGSLYAHEPGTVLLPIEGGFVRSFDIVIMVVLGGLGSISGAMLAAILLTVANEWLRDPTHVWHIAGIVLVIRLIVWPHQRLRAAVWGVILIGLAELAYMLAEHWEVALGDYRMILYALVLILMMILRPGGLFGTSEITDLFQQRRRLLERGRRPEAVPTT
jgi:ABC-type branched-subunit amino acid transport system permease subunit